MPQKTFSIYSENLQLCNLFIETGKGHVALWCRQSETNKVKAFELFRFDGKSENSFENILREIKLNSRIFDSTFDSVYLIWEDEAVVAIPTKYYSTDVALDFLLMMHPDLDGINTVANEIGDITLISNSFSNKKNAFKKYFNLLGDAHKFSMILKKYLGEVYEKEGASVHLLFYSGHFIITVIKNNQLRLIQSRQYETPEDVLFMILNSCRQNDMDIKETKVIAGGMVDINSGLYNTLFSYLMFFEIETIDKNILDAVDFEEYPVHYFASFFNYAV